MNKENMLALADFIEEGHPGIEFDMDPDDVSSTEICGHEYIRNHGLEGAAEAFANNGYDVVLGVRRSLGLSAKEGMHLFTPWLSAHRAVVKSGLSNNGVPDAYASFEKGGVTREKVANTIRWAALYGKVDERCWSNSAKGMEAPR